MSVAAVQFHSTAIGKDTTYQVILPDVGEGPFPVLMQLHGLSDDASAWIQQSSLLRQVAPLPLMVVLPDGGTSGYLNWRASGLLGKASYEDLLVADIPAHLARHFQVRPGPWAIGGLSMGGYGSMRLGLKYPEQFASIWSHSSAFQVGLLAASDFLTDPVDANIYEVANRLATRPTKPVISFDCGVDDELISHSRTFHRHLTQLGLMHTYAEHPGAHTWEYWDQHLPAALRQHARVLSIAEHPVPKPF